MTTPRATQAKLKVIDVYIDLYDEAGTKSETIKAGELRAPEYWLEDGRRTV